MTTKTTTPTTASETSETPGRDLIARLKQDRPDVAITVSREPDAFPSWDGDGPHPADEGCVCYDWTVRAVTIRHGEIVAGEAYLGGSWYAPEDRGVAYQEVSGYLRDMVTEALAALDTALAAAGGAR